MALAPTDRQMPASWQTRAAAFVIDVLLIVTIATAIMLLVIVVTGHAATDRTFTRQLAYAICIPLSLAYAPLLLTRRGVHNGQTIGKQAMKIRVVHGSSETITLTIALRRELLGRQFAAAITYGIYIPFDYGWALRDSANQCLHDKLAQTLVVQTSARPASTPTPLHAPETPIRGWLPPSHAD